MFHMTELPAVLSAVIDKSPIAMPIPAYLRSTLKLLRLSKVHLTFRAVLGSSRHQAYREFLSTSAILAGKYTVVLPRFPIIATTMNGGARLATKPMTASDSVKRKTANLALFRDLP